MLLSSAVKLVMDLSYVFWHPTGRILSLQELLHTRRRLAKQLPHHIRRVRLSKDRCFIRSQFLDLRLDFRWRPSVCVECQNVHKQTAPDGTFSHLPNVQHLRVVLRLVFFDLRPGQVWNYIDTHRGET